MIEELKECRICGSKNLESVLNLGIIHRSAFLKDDERVLESDKDPLEICICMNCGLAQLKHTVDLDLMYRQYWYSSSLNKSMVSSLQDVVYNIEKYGLALPGETVLDIGCNDGTLLDLYIYSDQLCKVGFDPAINIAHPDCAFVNDYFSAGKYKTDVLDLFGKAKVITAIAMFYDLPDPNKFVQDIVEVMDEKGIFVIQLTDLLSMFKLTAFDNICHEHLEYYSLNVLKYLLNRHGLEIIDISYNSVNGGSARIISAFPGVYKVSSNVNKYIYEEQEYFNNHIEHTFHQFHKNMVAIKEELTQLICDINSQGKSIYLMGASTKGNTLLQVCDLTKFQIKGAAEVNREKWGLRTVGSDIKIMSEEEVMKLNPDYLLILPWHFTASIIEKHKDYLENGGKFIVPLPKVRVIEKKIKEMDISHKTVAFMIDQLITTSHRCWDAQERIMDESLPEHDRLEWAIRAQEMNAKRSALMRAIDERLGEGDFSQDKKTYYTYFDKRNDNK